MVSIDQSGIKKNKWLELSLVTIAGITVGSVFLFCFYSPLVKIIQYAISDSESFTITEIGDILQKNLNIQAILFSLSQGFWSMSLCLLIGIPTSFIIAKYSFPGKRILTSLLTVSFILPSTVALLGFISTFGTGGWFNQVWYLITQSSSPLIKIYGTYSGILIAHVFYNISIIVRMGIPAWKSIDYEQIWVAKTLGVSAWKRFQKIILPHIQPYLISAGLLVFTYCFNSFAIVLMLGEARFSSLEVRIFKELQINLDFQESTVLALIQLLINIVIIGLYVSIERKIRQNQTINPHPLIETSLFKRSPFKMEFLKQILSFFWLILVSLFCFAPIIGVVILSLTPHSPDVSMFWGYREIFSSAHSPLLGTSPVRMVFNTLGFGLLNMGFTFFISLGVVFLLRKKYHRVRNYQRPLIDPVLNGIILLPMASSSITLAVGLFLQFKDSWLYSNMSWLIIILAHTLLSVPFATRAMLNAYNKINVEYLNVAASLGASRLYMFRKIEFPMIRQGLIVAITFAFAISIGEFGATTFLARDGYYTLSLGIGKLLSSRTLQLPAAMATLLIIFTFFSFLIIDTFDHHSKKRTRHHQKRLAISNPSNPR